MFFDSLFFALIEQTEAVYNLTYYIIRNFHTWLFHVHAKTQGYSKTTSTGSTEIQVIAPTYSWWSLLSKWKFQFTFNRTLH